MTEIHPPALITQIADIIADWNDRVDYEDDARLVLECVANWLAEEGFWQASDVLMMEATQ